MTLRPQDFMTPSECKAQAIAEYLKQPLKEVRAELRQMESAPQGWHKWAIEGAREAVERMSKQ